MSERTMATPAGGILQTGQSKLADVLERAGQQGIAEQVRSPDLQGLDDQIGKRVRQIEDQVRRKPIRTIAIGILAGFFAGRILRD